MESIVSRGSINRTTAILCPECLISPQNLCIQHVSTSLSHLYLILITRPFIYFCSFVKFYALIVVISLSD